MAFAAQLELWTRPNAVVKDPAEQRQIRILSGVCLTMTIAQVLLMPVWIASLPYFAPSPAIGLLIIASLVSAYGLSRTVHYRYAPLLLIGAFLVLILSSVLTASGPMHERLLVLPYLIIPIAISRLFMDRRATGVLLAFSFALIMSLFLMPDVPRSYPLSNLIFFLLILTLVAISAVTTRTNRAHLVESAALYRSVISVISEGVILQMADGQVNTANPAAEQILGLSKAALLEGAMLEHFWNAKREDGTPLPLAMLPNMYTLRTGEPLSQQVLSITRPDGQVRWLSVSSQPLQHSSKSKPYAVVVSFSDITERVEHERDLLREQIRYRALYEQSHDAVFILDLKGKHIQANQRAAEMLGYTVEEINQISYLDVSYEPEASAEVQQRLMAGEHIPGYERRFRRKDGSVITVEINVELVRDVDGQPLHVQSIARDITERKKTEAALHASEARQRALINAIPDLIFRQSRDGTYLDYHAPNPQDLVISPDRFMGRKVMDVMPPPIGQMIMEATEKVLTTNQEQVIEYSLTLGGHFKAFESRIVAANEDEVLAIVRNVSERKVARQREMDLALERERVRILNLFVQNASHELRTPLSIISMGLSMMVKLTDEERRRELAKRGEAQIQRMTRLLTMTLDLTRLDSAVPFDFQLQSLNDIVDQVVDWSQRRLQDHTLTLTFERDNHLQPIQVDAGRLIQALEQVLDNAMRYSPPRRHICLRTYQSSEYQVIEVTDQGIGIAPDALSNIFERFWRQDEARTTPGFGLGLSIALKILEGHGGTITAESTVGEGSCFRLLLPEKNGKDES